MTIVWKYSFYLEFLIIFFEEIHINNIKSLKKIMTQGRLNSRQTFCKIFLLKPPKCVLDYQLNV